MFEAPASDELEEHAASRDEAGRVRVWRFEEFLRLGFGTSAAFGLVHAGADLGLARRLISLGCPPGTAVSILH